MNEQDKYAKPLSADENVILELAEPKDISVGRFCVFKGSQSLHMLAKEFVDKLKDGIYQSVSNNELFDQGIKVTKLERGKKRVTGSIRFRLVIEFVPEIREGTTRDLLELPLNVLEFKLLHNQTTQGRQSRNDF